MFERIQYVKDPENYSSYSLHLKQIPCPHCFQIGYLNRHGFLKGYGEKYDEKIIRGYRIFCCNRGQRLGCGKTHCVLFANCLYRHSIRCDELTLFFNKLLEGLSLERAWFCSAKKRCVETGRAIWRRFSRTHLGIRSKLFGKENQSSQKEPRLVTWEAILEHFRCADPIGNYQLRFQHAFFSSG